MSFLRGKRLDQLGGEVGDLPLPKGIGAGLTAEFDAAVAALDDTNPNNNVASIGALRAFINRVKAQRGLAISEEDADWLIAEALTIIELLSEEL